jgi:nucleotide-binding universal stress UspA family protein
MLPLSQTLGVKKIVLVGVWESLWQEQSLGRRDDELRELAEKGRSYLHSYLTDQAERVKGLGFEVELDVRVGRAADEVLESANKGGADLIIIATHGRDGMARWRLGSVADKIVRHAECPTLVVGPNVNTELAPYSLSRILVPLDGSALAEEALPVAIWIAQANGAELDLVRVVSLVIPGDGIYGGMGYSYDLLTDIEDAARAYLAGVAKKLEGKVSARTQLLLGYAPDQLLAHIEHTPAQLVVLASHGRSGVVRTALGSVADRLLHGPAPVLVLRPEQVKSRLVEAALSAEHATKTGG